MTQTAEKPISLTYDKLHEKFETNFPTLLAPLERAKAKLDRGEGAQELANIIHCEVQTKETPTEFVYTWKGQKGTDFEYHVLKPFDPTPAHKPEPVQEAPEVPEAHQDTDEPPAEASDEPTEVEALLPVLQPEAEAETPASQPTANPERPSSSAGLFTALAELIGSSTLLMTVAKHDDELTVNIMPFGDDKDTHISAVCVSATPAELDEGFAEVIRVKVEGRKSLAEQTEALKQAEKALADAKKAEADAKKVEGGKKKKASENRKMEDEKKKQEEEAAAEKAKAQEALF